MSQRAVTYVRERQLTDPDAERVFLLIAELTADSGFEYDDSPMGLLLSDAEIPGLADSLRMRADRFRSLLCELRGMVPMDVLEHHDGTWEIVYGPGYANLGPRPAADGDEIGPINMFTMLAGSIPAPGA